MRAAERTDVVIVGAGIAGIAAAYYLTRECPDKTLALVDAAAPMSFTSAQSGENYRNWWPHPAMTAFTDHSIDLMRALVDASGRRIRMTARGYALATRSERVDAFLEQLRHGYAGSTRGVIREHGRSDARGYFASLEQPGTGVDVLADRGTIRKAFPAFDPELRHVFHVRRAGDVDSHQLGQFMLEAVRNQGGRVIRGDVVGIENNRGFHVALADKATLNAERLLIAAGPFARRLVGYLDETLPVVNVLQQKLAFEDKLAAIPRAQPFAVDLDRQHIDWTPDERDLLAGDDQYGWLTDEMPGGVHRRPDGGATGTWVRLGWAFNQTVGDVSRTPALDDNFPEIVLRGAARLNPALKRYYDYLPAKRSHYGGYYTMTEENMPLIGPLQTDGAFVIGALSGFGTMAACAAGAICARWIGGGELPGYAKRLSLQRYADPEFMAEVRSLNDKGLL